MILLEKTAQEATLDTGALDAQATFLSLFSFVYIRKVEGWTKIYVLLLTE